jgi:hypothetical protein
MMPGKVAVLVAALVLVVVASAPRAQTGAGGNVAGHDYVGAERCRSCHEQAFTMWSTSPHARALDALPEKDRNDPRCLTCHTMVVDDRSPALVGVQCETCHGPGRHYSVEYVMRDADLRVQTGFLEPAEKTCLRCHTEASPSLRPFTYAEKLEAIRHW